MILWLTMHIGVVPVELANQEGGLDLSELEELTYGVQRTGPNRISEVYSAEAA